MLIASKMRSPSSLFSILRSHNDENSRKYNYSKAFWPLIRSHNMNHNFNPNKMKTCMHVAALGCIFHYLNKRVLLKSIRHSTNEDSPLYCERRRKNRLDRAPSPVVILIDVALIPLIDNEGTRNHLCKITATSLQQWLRASIRQCAELPEAKRSLIGISN